MSSNGLCGRVSPESSPSCGRSALRGRLHGRRAGIRVLMITGDYPGTAQSIAREIGLASPDDVVTGPELDAMDDATLREHAPRVSIYARVSPYLRVRGSLVVNLNTAPPLVLRSLPGMTDATLAVIVEELEEKLIDQATAAGSVSELEDEIRILDGLERQAKEVVASGQDRKWEELSRLLQDDPFFAWLKPGPRSFIWGSCCSLSAWCTTSSFFLRERSALPRARP